MKLEEITDIGPIEEIAPAGFGKRLATGLKRKAASFVGARNVAARLGGEQQSQMQANAIFQNFNVYLGRIGKRLGNATSGDVQTFMQSQNMVVPDQIKTLPPDSPVPKDIISQAFMSSMQASAQQQAKTAGIQHQVGGAMGAGGIGGTRRPRKQRKSSQNAPSQGVTGSFSQFISTLSPQQKQALKNLL
jgi:hypothetical protein